MNIIINSEKIGKIFNSKKITINDSSKKLVDSTLNKPCIETKKIHFTAKSIFISYSHEDEDMKILLEKHLSPLKRNNEIIIWSDRKIIGGEEWDCTIRHELEKADIILLLISANFIASDYIWEVEIKKAIERHEKKEAIVIPIFCRYCDFKNMPFAMLQGLPVDAKPITSFDDIDKVFKDVVDGIKSALKKN
jgi:hypothetical protein